MSVKHQGTRALALFAGVCVAVLAGCASPQGDAAGRLARRLQSLGPSVSPREATLAAETAFACSLRLADEYRVVRPPIFHNLLVNAGLRKRGLCYHWAEDLSARLQSLNLETLRVRRGAARLKTRREHSSVVLTAAAGQPFDEGVVLDAWRRSGRLYWGEVKTDKYPWIEVEVVTKAQESAPHRAAGR